MIKMAINLPQLYLIVVLIVQEAYVVVKEAVVLMEVMILRVVVLKVANFVDVLIVDKIIIMWITIRLPIRHFIRMIFLSHLDHFLLLVNRPIPI